MINKTPDINHTVIKVVNEFEYHESNFSRIKFLTTHEIKQFIRFMLSILNIVNMSQYTLDCYGIGALYTLNRDISFFQNQEDHDIYDAVYTWTEESNHVTTTRSYYLGFIGKDMYNSILKNESTLDK